MQENAAEMEEELKEGEEEYYQTHVTKKLAPKQPDQEVSSNESNNSDGEGLSG
jgi:DNA polymerase II large subunit